MPRTLLLLLALSSAFAAAKAAKEVVVPIDGLMKPGATSLPVIKCPSGFHLSSKDADIMLARQLTDSYFAQIGRVELLQHGNIKYGCPAGADFVDGDPLFSPISAQALGETKHNSVSVCVPPSRRNGDVATIYAQSVINYHCKNSPSKPLHIGIVLAKGKYKVGGGSLPTPHRCGNGYADTRGVTPIRGSVKPGVAQLPPLSCPPNYYASMADADIVLGRKLVDAYFIQMGRAQLLKEGNKKYGCPSGADFVDGDPLFRPDPVAAQALGQTKHNSVSVCMPRKTTPGVPANFFAQGVINYHCCDAPKTALNVGLVIAKGTYTPNSGGAGGPQAAADALGADVYASAWLAAHPPGDRSLVQGLKGDPTYLVVGEMGLEKYGVNSICTHLGCVVPWNAAENKFMCPCHGSQYDAQGKKVRGPAPLSLALAHADVDDRDVVMLSPWTETDFRDGSEPWWA